MKYRAEKVVSALPAPLEPDTVYFVRSGLGFDIYVTDQTASVAFQTNTQSINDLSTVKDIPVLTVGQNGQLENRRVLPYSVNLRSDVPRGNSSSNFQFYFVDNFTVPEDGNYKVEATYVWSYNTTTSDFVAEIIIDSQTITRHQQEPKDSAGTGITVEALNFQGTLNSGTNQRIWTTMSDVIPLTAGAHAVGVWFGGVAPNVSAIYKMNILITRID